VLIEKKNILVNLIHALKQKQIHFNTFIPRKCHYHGIVNRANSKLSFPIITFSQLIVATWIQE